MKPFTMNPDTLNPTSKPMLPRELGAAHELAHDDAGRLYSVRMRELFENLHVEMSAVEALGALKIAVDMLGLVQVRSVDLLDLTKGRLGTLWHPCRCGVTLLCVLITVQH